MANLASVSYRDLRVWQEAKAYAIEIYKISRTFPKSEEYGLTSQMRRAAVSIPSNIAEGFRRRKSGEKIQFMSVAYGSGAELETQLEIARDLNYVDLIDYKKLSDSIDKLMRMMNRAIHSLQNSA